MSHRSEEVLEFWLEEAGPQKWYGGGAAFDDEIRARFLDLWEEGRAGKLADWAGHPRKLLALLIVLDQFPRNMFRGDARSFATDVMAKKAACTALNRGWDKRFGVPERQFFYLPFMHSEMQCDQDHSVRLFLARMPESLSHALAHREVIRRYGRFPYRNDALGRQNSAAEEAFLTDGGYGKILAEIEAEER